MNPFEDERDFGPQPIDAIMEHWQLTNHDLVTASPEQLNHKQVQKARKGRKLTLHLMQKITRALNIAVWQRLTQLQREAYFEYPHSWLFSYAKGYQADRPDPNAALQEILRSS